MRVSRTLLPDFPFACLCSALAFLGLSACSRPVQSAPPQASNAPPFVTLDLDLGERKEVRLSDGATVSVRLIGLESLIDSVSGTVRESSVTVEVNGQTRSITSATYRLPERIGGVQIDCPITRDYLRNSRGDPWGLKQAARLRLWPGDALWMPEGSFHYPVRQRWFASSTQMANEPVHVDGGELPGEHPIYYHSGLDFGGAEGLVEVVATCDGMVVAVGDSALPQHVDNPVDPRYDVVYLLDERGWFHRYSHLHAIEETVRPGAVVKAGQKVGVLGKEGGSGGWSHLHYEIVGRQPSGAWGTIDAYAFVWEAYLREVAPELIAVARPHQVGWAGEPVELDATRSWSRAGRIASTEWRLTDGTRASGPRVTHVYDVPGSHSEILEVTDAEGNVSIDFATVQVLDPRFPDRLPPTIHAAYAPTTDLFPGTPIVFKVRTFRATAGEEVWDFGDGSPPVRVLSDGNREPLAEDGYAETVHVYERPGRYVVSVERTNEWGYRAVGRLAIYVEVR